MERVEPKDLAEWRTWLDVNHAKSEEIWLVLQKAGKKDSALSMTDVVDEALCYGWIDSRTRRLDDVRYMLRLTPRKVGARWSDRNLRRARELIDEGQDDGRGHGKIAKRSQTACRLSEWTMDRRS